MLGNIISGDKVDPEKIETIKNYPIPSPIKVFSSDGKLLLRIHQGSCNSPQAII